MAKYDLYHLSDDVLFLSNDNFYNFVTQVCGKVEAEILQIQGIQNARSLIRCTNLFSILEIDCEEIEKLKPNICFISKKGEYFIRQGVQLNLNNLCDALKVKHNKYKKKERRHTSLSSVLTLQATTAALDDSNNLIEQNSEIGTTTNSSSSIPLVTTDLNSSSSRYTSISDHVEFINDLIEKFSHKLFTSTVLKGDEHYQVTITRDEQTFKAIIKCQCGTKLILPSRSHTTTFILSNYYAHLTATKCSMVERIHKREKMTNDKSLEVQPSPNKNSSKRTNGDIDTSEQNTNLKKRKKR